MSSVLILRATKRSKWALIWQVCDLNVILSPAIFETTSGTSVYIHVSLKYMKTHPLKDCAIKVLYFLSNDIFVYERSPPFFSPSREGPDDPRDLVRRPCQSSCRHSFFSSLTCRPFPNLGYLRLGALAATKRSADSFHHFHPNAF